MRISTNTIFSSGISRITELQANQVKLQQQISTQRRILTPSDDPTGSARAIDLLHAKNVNEQYIKNRLDASTQLSFEESTLASVTDLLLNVRSNIIAAGNGGLANEQRLFIAAEVRGQLDQLLGYANARDSIGEYIFAGSRTDTPPFVKTATGATYNGNDLQRMLQISTSRQIELGDTGNDIFQAGGSDVFTVLTDLANILSSPVTDATTAAALRSGLSAATTGVDRAMDAVLTTRAMVGSRLKEIDSLESYGQELNIQYAQALSEIQDLDYAKALSEFTQTQTILEAAQRTFSSAAQLSLFNYL